VVIGDSTTPCVCCHTTLRNIWDHILLCLSELACKAQTVMQNDCRLVPSLRHITLFARSSAVVWNEQYSLPPSFIADHLELLQFLTVADCCSACQTCTPCEVSCPDKRVGPVTTYTFRYAVQIRTQLLLFLSSLPASSTGQLRRRYTAFNCVCVSLYVVCLPIAVTIECGSRTFSNVFELYYTLNVFGLF